ncbi:MAG: hypothetical protein Q9169_005301, partial [Polycauliona sp. 2 TL-2023]
MRGEIHDQFETLTIHTAKCDLCNAHNTSKMYRCTKCGRHTCSACWDAKGGDGRHTVHDQRRLAYTGPVAEVLPPLEEGKVKTKAKAKEDGRKKGKGKAKKDGEKDAKIEGEGQKAEGGKKDEGKKKTLIVSLKVPSLTLTTASLKVRKGKGIGKKRSRDDNSDVNPNYEEDEDEDQTPPTDEFGLTQGSAAAAEHKRRRNASGGYSSISGSPTTPSNKNDTPRKGNVVKDAGPSDTNNNSKPKPQQDPRAHQPSTPKHTSNPTPSTPGKGKGKGKGKGAKHQAKVPYSSLPMSPIMRILTQAQRRQEPSYDLDEATDTLLALGQDAFSSSQDADDTELENE